MKRRTWILTIAASVTCFNLLSLLPKQAVASQPDEFRVMSFNVRYGTAKDGDNHWDNRKELLIETIKHFNPDLLGTQETMDFQKDFIAKKLTGYGVEGVGRNDGKSDGEMMAVFYRKSRFEKLEAGHFWLSETPEVVGSKSWDSSLPRMATWLKLRDRQVDKELYFLNTHFDHRGTVARAESATLIRNWVRKLGPDATVIVTGDFNATEGSPPYQNLFGQHEEQQTLIDAYRQKHPVRNESEATFNNFTAGHVKGGRIDWIGVSKNVSINHIQINHFSENGRLPSDHYPIEASFSHTH